MRNFDLDETLGIEILGIQKKKFPRIFLRKGIY